MLYQLQMGKYFWSLELFYQGKSEPAMNAGLSVSRVGGAAQLPAMKDVAGKVRLELAQYNELKAFAQFGSDLDVATRKTLQRGKVLVEVLKQGQYSPMNVALQVATLFAAKGYLDEVAVENMGAWERGFHKELASSSKQILTDIKEGKKLKKHRS